MLASTRKVLTTRAGTDVYKRQALAGAAELANKLIGENQTFEDICFALQKFAESTHILCALASFDNLAKNGRVSKVGGDVYKRQAK